MNSSLKNDVFMNNAFEDIGKSFISHLKGALKLNSFSICDHTTLPIGQNAYTELLKAIEESEIYVVVFSPDYASSTRCLDELVHIMDSFRKLDQRKVFPVFFKVEPTHVRNQQGPFMEPFQAHNTSVDPKRVQKWRQALKDAGQLSGLELQNGMDEAKFVLEIVEQLEKMQRLQELHVTDHPVGVGSRAEELISTLRLDWKYGVLVVAVYGLGGIGKTTIVKEAFNRIAPSFDLSCFLADIHYICQVPNWKVELPKTLISCLTGENLKLSFMNHHNDGVTKIRRLVSGRKVLLVLDDIDNFQQLESLGVGLEYFYKGSRIIVTTRDKRSLGIIPYVSYHIRLLNRRESLNLFTRLMFVRDVDIVNTTFIKEVVGRAGGHPLVLKVWSCHFKQYDREQWPSILETLKEIPHDDVQKQLQMSYDSLTNRAKKLFLDIACFFNHEDADDKNLVVKLLQDENSRFFPDNEMLYLVDKGLVEITSENRLRMHRAVREMGHEIVRQECEEEPGQRSRLLNKRDLKHVLKECSGTESVESIVGSFKNMREASLEAFRKMSNLRLISLVNYESNFSHDEMVPLCFKKLKGLFWVGFPFKSLDIIEMCNIVVLRIYEGKLERLWDGIKNLKKLRILDVTYSYSLIKTGNFSGLKNLEELNLNNCYLLEVLDSSIGCLKKLAILNLRSSVPVKNIPWEMIGKLASLKRLIVGDDHQSHRKDLELDEVNDTLLYTLQECPISELEFYKCNISCGFVSLASLKRLFLYNCEIPSYDDSLLQLHGLKTFELSYCRNIKSIPNLSGKITSIKVDSCYGMVNLPCNISELKSVTVLEFNSCPKLGTEDPDFLMKVAELTNLTRLKMSDCGVCHVPIEIGNLVSLKELDLSRHLDTLCSLPDSLSNQSQLLLLNIEQCYKFKLLPLLPSNLTYIHASICESLDLMSSASLRTKVNKDSPFSNRFMINFPLEKEEVPAWCNYQSRGDVLSFVSPVHNNHNICGFFLCANTTKYVSTNMISKMYNKTKNTSHRFVTINPSGNGGAYSLKYHMRVMSYPLNDTTLVMEAGDSVVLKFPQGSISSCGLRLIYESDVVDGELVIQTVTKPDSCVDSIKLPTLANDLDVDSQDYSCSSGDEDYSSSNDEDYF